MYGMKKVGRNELCPCGSGKKYKFCCLNEMRNEDKISEFMNEYRKLSKDAKIKHCIHPNKDECNDKIIKAHAIQNNRVLLKLSENGNVVTMDGLSNIMFQDARSRRRKIATTFSGFCGYHDKILFQEIEDKEFEETPRQVFLYTYRTLAWHYHKKLEQKSHNDIFKELVEDYNLINNKNEDMYGENLRKASLENESKMNLFNKYLLDEDYENINYKVWKIPYEIQFAISTMLEIEHDILGNEINNLYRDEYLKSVYLNIFPAEGCSYCIWSWESTDKVYENFVKQFMDLNIKDKMNYLNNNLPRWTDSLVFSPRIWNRWGEQIQQALISHSNYDFLYRQMQYEEKKFAYEYMYTPWNIFEQL